MNVEQIQAKLSEIKAEVGTGRERIHLNIEVHQFCVSIYPLGLCNSDGMAVHEHAATAEQALDGALAAFRKKRAAADSYTTERMALAIISATHRYGECSKANLRCDFGGDVDRLGDDAVALANSMSEAGPFDLTEDEGRNAA